MTAIPRNYRDEDGYIQSVLCLINLKTLLCHISHDFGKSFSTNIEVDFNDNLTSIKEKVASCNNIASNILHQTSLHSNIISHKFLKGSRIFMEDSMLSLISDQCTSSDINRIFHTKGGVSLISVDNEIEYMKLSLITQNTYPEIICLRLGLENPEYVSDCIDIVNIDGYTHFTKDCWKIDDLIGSNLETFNQLEKCKQIILDSKYKSVDFTLIRLLYKSLIYCTAMKFINDFIMNLDLYLGTKGKIFDNIYSNTTLIFSRLITSIADLDMSILPVQPKEILRNSSKYEVSLALLLENVFNKYSLGSVKSCVTLNGQLETFTLSNSSSYSSDIFCPEQRICISVEGTFKSDCPQHKSDPKKIIWGLSREFRTNRARERLDLVQNYCSNNNIKHYIFRTCCLKDVKSNVLFNFFQIFNKASNIDYFYIKSMYKKLLDNFDPKKYKRINFQESILPNYIFANQDIAISNKSDLIKRFDKVSCYPSILLSSKFRVPIGNSVRYLGLSAQQYYENHLGTTIETLIGVCKTTCYPPIKRIMPYLCIKINNNSVLSNCRSCSEVSYQNGISLKSCCHNVDERCFSLTLDIKDVWYLKQFGYTFNITELVLFNSVRPVKLQETVRYIMENFSTSIFFLKWIKNTLLAALGRFACDSQKYKAIQMINKVDFFLYLTCNQLEDFEFIGKENDPICVGKLKVKKQNYELNYRNQVKFKTNSLLFGSLVSYNRREIHTNCIILSCFNPVTVLLRVDTDSITIQTKNWLCSIIEKYFLTMGYSIDSNIIGLKNISLRSYIIWFSTSNIEIKTCGLILSFYARNIKILSPIEFRNFSLK